MVRQSIVDLTAYDVTNFSIKSDVRINNGVLRKIRTAGKKARVYIPVQGCVVLDVKTRGKEVCVSLHPIKPLVDFVLALEKECINKVAYNKVSWFEDANMSVDDAHRECIRFTHEHGKILQLRMKPGDVSVLQVGSTINCMLGIEGLYFKNGRFGLMWSIDDVHIVGDLCWRDRLDICDYDCDCDEIAEPDTMDIVEMKGEIAGLIDRRMQDAMQARSDLDRLITKLTTLHESLMECDTDTAKIEHVRNALEDLV